jgi:hypothetical protein
MKNGVRLAFRGKNVIEAKNMKTGATHTPAEFAADRAKNRRRVPSIHAKRLASAQVSRAHSASKASRSVAARKSAHRKGVR